MKDAPSFDAPDAVTSGKIEKPSSDLFSWWPIITIIGVSGCVELLMLLSDAGVIRQARLRQDFYEYAGFWSGLLENWRPNYAAQPYTMYVTYAFVHGGIVHLIVNMMTLWSLAPVVLRRVGVTGFTILYTTSMVGGAFGFVLLSDATSPMVGASGALFGLAGGILAWSYVDKYTFQENRLPVLQAVGLLVLMNVALCWVLDGRLAWETHLGGFLSGWCASLLIDPRSRPEE